MHVKSTQVSFADLNILGLGEVYAQGLLGSIPDDNQAELVSDELAAIVELVDSIQGAKQLLTQAMLTKSQRSEVVKKVFFGRTSTPVEALIWSLLKRGRMEILWPAAGAFKKLLNIRQGTLEVEIVTAVELEKAVLDSLRDEITKIAHRKIILTHNVDRSIIAGLKLCIGDQVYDASIDSALRRFMRKFRERLGEPQTGNMPNHQNDNPEGRINEV